MPNKQIIIRQPNDALSNTPDELGNVRGFVSATDTMAWATVVERSGKEDLNIDGVVTSSAFTLFTFRVEWAAGLTQSWRIRYAGPSVVPTVTDKETGDGVGDDYDIISVIRKGHDRFYECHWEQVGNE